MSVERTIVLASRGSPLALAQTRLVLAQAQATFPLLRFSQKIVKTTGDKLQSASLAKHGGSVPLGLFTKELEIALLEQEADLAVHSLKDLPTQLPDGLTLAGVTNRADVRDVLIYRGLGTELSSPVNESAAGSRPFDKNLPLATLPAKAKVATGSTRRREQLLAVRPDVEVVEIRGNVGTRLEKLAHNTELDAIILAAAGLARLGIGLAANGDLHANNVGQNEARPSVPQGLLGFFLPLEIMLPCVGQAAVAMEVRRSDSFLTQLCAQLNHEETFQCVSAERAFLRAMGGGCQSPVAAHGEVVGGRLRLRAVSFRGGQCRRAEMTGAVSEPENLGIEMARQLR